MYKERIRSNLWEICISDSHFNIERHILTRDMYVYCVIASLLTNEKHLGKLLKMFQMYIWCGFIIRLKYSKETNFREKLLQKPVTSLFSWEYRNLYILEYHVTSGFSLRVKTLDILFVLKKRRNPVYCSWTTITPHPLFLILFFSCFYAYFRLSKVRLAPRG